MARQLPAKQLEVGSGTDQPQAGLVPTGVSDRPTAGSDSILYKDDATSELFFRWKVAKKRPTAELESMAHDPGVVGSNPTGAT